MRLRSPWPWSSARSSRAVRRATWWRRRSAAQAPRWSLQNEPVAGALPWRSSPHTWTLSSAAGKGSPTATPFLKPRAPPSRKPADSGPGQRPSREVLGSADPGRWIRHCLQRPRATIALQLREPLDAPLRLEDADGEEAEEDMRRAPVPGLRDRGRAEQASVRGPQFPMGSAARACGERTAMTERRMRYHPTEEDQNIVQVLAGILTPHAEIALVVTNPKTNN